MMDDDFDLLKACFLSVLGTDRIELDFNRTTISNWDSLNHIKLIVEIERRFNFRFRQVEIESMRSVDDIYRAISGRKGR